MKRFFGLLFFFGLAFFSCQVRQSDFFPNKKASHLLIEEGWLPDKLPESARDIYILYDENTNERWISFSCNWQDRQKLASSLVKAESIEKIVAILQRWPSSFNIDIQQDNDYVIYSSDNLFYAISPDLSTVYAWTRS